ncbi:cupin domain-containing protein [Seongchinamella sediminis]|uniref:Cupin domain-containing protein n=1 Tax=Seongchinamella sediminis TaxID=2283635 RepID=A0A3L7DUY6_9GAMM|nr:cupin domain-containing protein [Seongchinamella sediminis]RLQ20595.1 cupin domain-containing protein [Seongchinamella sediminis]
MGQELQIDKDAFLARHWQRKPLLMPQALPDFRVPIAAGELAGLAMEDGIESRIISCQADQWQLSHGPFSEADFQRDGPWTLLVQAVDHYIPEVARLRQLVDFIPRWRIDDVMVSYASDGGSVGPHYDNYDVFLLQGEGQRLWRLGQYCDHDSPLAAHDELRILANFDQQAEFLLSPGDILYVPPGTAHWGIAQGECTTFSIGFRAPRVSELVSRFTDQLLTQLEPEQFYHDAGLEPATRAGEIRPRDLERVAAQLQAALDESVSNHWFGELVTEPCYTPFPDDDELAEARAILADGPLRVSLNPAARLAWQHEENTLVVFANGDSRCFSDDLLSLQAALCRQALLAGDQLASATRNPQGAQWLDYLLESGCIYVE